MTSYKKIGIALGAVVVVAGASAGGYMLLKKNDESTESEAKASTSASAKQDDEVAPLDSLALVIPENVDAYLEVPSVRALAQGTANMKVVDVGLLDLMSSLDRVGAGVGQAFGLDAKDGSAFVSSIKTVAIAARFSDDEPFAGGVIASTKPAVVTKLLATERFSKRGKIGDVDKYGLGSSTKSTALKDDDMLGKLAAGISTPQDVSIVWLKDKGLLLVGTDAFLKGVTDVVGGKQKTLAANADYKKELASLADKPRLIVYAPASALSVLAKSPRGKEALDGFFKDPGAFLGAFYTGAPGLLMTLEGGVQGDKVPTLAVPKAPKLTLASALPADTLGYMAFSTKLDMSGKDAEDKLVSVVRAYDTDQADEIREGLDKARTKLGVGMADVIDAFGEQMVIGLVTSDREIAFDDLSKIDIESNAAVIGLSALKDEAAMKKIVDGLKGKLPIGDTHNLSATDDGGFEASPKRAAPFIALRYPKGQLFVGVGAEALVKRAYDTIVAKKGTLGDDGAHKLAISGVPGAPHFVSWIDASRLLMKPIEGQDAIPGLDFINQKIVMKGDNRLTMTTALGLVERGKGYRVRMDMLNSFGVLPAVGIYGVRRYLARSKSSEAKNTIGAIARGAAAAFERETVGGGHTLCKSAAPVPSVVPSGKKYQPNTAEGSDFETGDDAGGWRCLKFAMTQPHYYQYGYSVGGPYKGPAVGGPDPGPNGFEAWAVGDLDGDGVTSLYTVTGTVDASGNLKRSTEIFIHNELE